MSLLSAEHLIPKRSFGKITREWLVQYAEASGDHNPIHQDEAVAKKMGLPGIIAHGMLIAGLLHSRADSALEGHADLQGAHLVQSMTRFRAMTLVGDEVSVGGTWFHESKDRLVFDLAAENQRGEILVQGKLVFVKKESHA